jgi:uncharacterized damage-inducible protein DinB
MTALGIVRGLVGYNYASHERLWDSIVQLTDEQFVQEVSYSHGSVRDQIIHVATVDSRWLRGLKGEPDARGYQLAEGLFANRETARTAWASVANDVVTYVEALTEAELFAAAPGMNEPRWQVLTHIVNHGTDHRAQLLRILHDCGAPTFSQDLIFHWWSAR